MNDENPMILLDNNRDHGGIMFVGGPHPYLWLGGLANNGACYGVVADKDVQQLHEWTGRILAARQAKPKRRRRKPATA